MALIRCPKCGKMISSAMAACPHCGGQGKQWTDASSATAREGSAARRFHSLSVKSAVPGTPDADAWIRFWANLCGGMLVVGFLFPMILSGFGHTQVVWPWDLMSGLKGHQALGTFLPL